MTPSTTPSALQATGRPLTIPTFGRRFDVLWTLLPFAVLAWLAGIGTPVGDLPIMAFFARALPVVAVMALASFGGMLLGLGVFWLTDLRLGDDARRPASLGLFGRSLAGGLLGALLAVLLLPRQPVYSMAQIGPWVFLSATILLLIQATLKEGAFDPAAIARTLAGGGTRPMGAVARDYVSMTKPGLNGLVLATTLVGYVMASRGATLDWVRCLWLMLGTAAVAGGSSVLNQVSERHVDARMARTAVRPLPGGRLHAACALTFGSMLAIGGLIILARAVGLGAAATAALTLGAYVFLYTPLKRINALSTLAGGIAGALPPMIGWIGGGGSVDTGGMLLFFILFFWQIPHFLAIAWKYREQYGAAGFPLYSVLDPDGRATGLQSLLYTVALLGVSLLCVRLGMAGWIYGVGATALGVGLLVMAVRFLRRPDAATARALFFATLIYLPVLLTLMIIDKSSALG
jgi:protoheme IX farnesyltransferase